MFGEFPVASSDCAFLCGRIDFNSLKPCFDKIGNQIVNVGFVRMGEYGDAPSVFNESNCLLRIQSSFFHKSGCTVRKVSGKRFSEVGNVFFADESHRDMRTPNDFPLQ